jgi:hypothetical protein
MLRPDKIPEAVFDLRRVALRALRFLTPAAIAVACNRDVLTPTREPRVITRHVAGVVAITFRNIGSPNMTSSALVASSMEELEALYAQSKHPAAFDLTVPKNQDGSGEAMIEVDLASTNTVTVSGVRYFDATYRVRNAQKTDSAAFNTPRTNLTFLTVGSARTIGDTPLLQFDKQDGQPADPALILQLKPAGAVVVNREAVVESANPDVLQIFTEPEVAAVVAPSVVTNKFPYGFMTRRAGSTTTRTLDASPTPDLFQGVVTFAFRIPIQANPAENPTTITFLMLALDDSQTRITQSLEEQNPAGALAVRNRATSLNALAIRTMPGGGIPGWPANKTQLICSVRTTGTAGAPTAFLVNAPSSFLSLTPNPYSAAGSIVPQTSTIAAMFSGAVTGAGPNNFIVRGLVSGQAFRGATYTTAGPVVTTPPGSFQPGEELEVVITSAISCPNPWAGRLRVAVATPSSGTVAFRSVSSTGTRTYRTTVGDFNRDGFLDIAKSNEGSDNVTILLGDGTGSFTVLTTFPVNGDPISITSADFNNDGILDLAVSNFLTANVSVFLGVGNGSFGPQLTFPLGGRAGQIVTGDVNADGALDLVVVQASTDNVAVLLGNGDGTFRPQISFATGQQPEGAAIGDFNEDGKLDIATANSGANGNSVSILLGDGNGLFVAAPDVPVGHNPFSVALADFNEDGILDLATANRGSLDISVRLGNGDGTFREPRLTSVRTQPADWVAAGDMNGDGILDLVVADGAGLIAMFRGLGDGTFAQGQILEVDIDPDFATLADVNRDGRLDIIPGSRQKDGFGVLLGQP